MLMYCGEHNAQFQDTDKCPFCHPKPKVVELAPRDNRTVKSTLETASQTNFVECLVIGIDNEGEFVFLSSGMSNRDGLWLAEKAKRWIMEGE